MTFHYHAFFIEPLHTKILWVVELNLLKWLPGVGAVTYDFDVTLRHNTLISKVFQLSF